MCFRPYKCCEFLILKPFLIYFHSSITDKEEKCMFTDTLHSCFVYIRFCEWSLIMSWGCGRPSWKFEKFRKHVGGNCGRQWVRSAVSCIKWSMGDFGDIILTLEGWKRQKQWLRLKKFPIHRFQSHDIFLLWTEGCWSFEIDIELVIDMAMVVIWLETHRGDQ